MSCTYDQDGVLLDDQTGAPCGQTIGPGNVYGGTVYGGGSNSNGVNTGLQTLLNSIFNTGLSTVALLKGRPYIPTTANPYNQAPPTIVTGLGGGGIGGGGSNLNNSSITAGTVGKVEAWIKKNPGVSAMIAGAVILFYAKPPQRGR